MSDYHDEQAQIDAIKRWFKENGPYIIGAIVVAAAVLGGRWWWQDHVRARGEAASEQFQQLITDIEAERYAAVVERGSHILNAYPGTAYAPLAALAVAKVKVTDGEYAAARTFLQWVLDNGDQEQMRHIARIRLARALLAEGKADAALDLLAGVDPGEFKSPYAAAQGDIYRALGQPERARAAYAEALEGVELDPAVLQWKLDALGGPEPAASKDSD